MNLEVFICLFRNVKILIEGNRKIVPLQHTRYTVAKIWQFSVIQDHKSFVGLLDICEEKSK